MHRHMTTYLSIFILGSFLSVGFMILTVYRLYRHIFRYRFPETKYTLLFGCIHLRWIAALYVILIIICTSLSILFIL